jgi:hypothetical protein
VLDHVALNQAAASLYRDRSTRRRHRTPPALSTPNLATEFRSAGLKARP